jgi:nucleotide-binding universal stress UspA family protein
MADDVILIPTDFEEASRRALAFGKDLAAKLGCEVVLLHVYQLPVYTYPGLEPAVLPSFVNELSQAAQRALDTLANEAAVKRALLREGDPATEILSAVDELSPRMVIMGTHGRRGLAHILIGSVAERVVRRSPVPVLTMRAPGAHDRA